jgi:hypothetical protein
VSRPHLTHLNENKANNVKKKKDLLLLVLDNAQKYIL